MVVTMDVYVAVLSVLFGICLLFKGADSANAAGFEVAVGGTNLLSLPDQGSTAINFVFTAGDGLTLKGTLDSGELIDGSVNQNDKTANATIQSTSLTGGFGTFLVTWELKPASGTSQKIEQVVFHEEPIEGFSLSTSKSVVEVGEEFMINLAFTKGTNIEIEYFLDENSTCLEEYNDTLRLATRNHTYTQAGEFNLTVVVANTISRTFACLTVTSQFPVQNFSLTTVIGPVQTTEDAKFTLKLIQNAQLPMGDIYLEIDYGDSNSENITSLSISTMQGAGHVQTHRYTKQGNYTVEACVRSDINSQCMTLDVYIWDNVVACLSADIVLVKTNQAINLKFINPPPTGFQYYIENGDGTTKSNDASALYSAYVDTPWTKTFSSPGIYKMISAAWNPFYVSVCEIEFTVQHPIVDEDITISPKTDEIPTPDGKIDITMTLTANHPTATNVTCTFDNGDGEKEENVSTDITHNFPIVKSYTYLTGGVKNVNFTCTNLVSNTTQTATITVKTFTLSDFQILHILNAPMNMSATIDEAGLPASKSDIGAVEFTTALFACSKLPPNITFEWNWGDGTASQTEPIKVTISHLYPKRGNYPLTVDLSGYGSTHQITSSVKLGVVTLSTDQETGKLNNVFTFNIDGLGAGGNYILNFDSEDPTFSASSGSPVSKTHAYPNWGIYNAFVIATNDTFYEKVYLEKPVKVDYLINNVLSVTFSNDTIELPPGIIIVNVSIPSGEATRPMVTCRFNMGDNIDTNVYNISWNISDSSPLTFNYSYLTLGEHEANINCSNFIDTFSNTSVIKAKNPCFDESGMFDRQYSTPAKPMEIFTSTDVAISSRMGVLCYDLNPSYTWSIYEVVSYEGMTVEVKDVEIIDDGVRFVNGTTYFKKGGLKPARYKVCLNVTLETTFAYECTYIKCRRPKPYASIVGGTGRKTKRHYAVDVDGWTDSYDCEKGYGGREGLNFTWFCYRYNVSSLESLTKIFEDGGGIDTFTNETFETNNTCGEMMVPTDNPGIIKLNSTSIDYNAFIAIVIVSLEHADTSYYAQNIFIVEGDPPETVVRCVSNCRDKVTLKEKFSLTSECMDCSDDEKLRLAYDWEIHEYNPSTGSHDIVPNQEAMSLTGLDSKNLVVAADSFNGGSKYNIILYLTLFGKSKRGEATWSITTNLAPYEGSCSVKPKEGNATSTKFAINCPGWLDEGNKEERDPAKDAYEPLFYEYFLIRKIMKDGVEKEWETPLFKGSESTATQLLLQVGDSNFNYTVTFKVLICDRFGDCNSTTTDATVKPNQAFIPTNANDTSAVTEMMDNFNDVLQQSRASGNPLSVLRAISSQVSMNQLVSDGMGKDSPVVASLQKSNTDMINIMRSMVSNDSKDALNPGDTNNLVQSFRQSVSNPDLMDDESYSTVVESLKFLTASTVAQTDTKPFPVEDIENIERISNGSLGAIEKILESMVPKEIEDLNTKIDEDTVYEDLYGYNDTDVTPEVEAERRIKAKEVYETRMANRREQREKEKNADAMSENLLAAVNSVQTMQASLVQPGEKEKIINMGDLFISIEKNTLKDYNNRTDIERKGFQIGLGNLTLSNNTDIEIKTAVFPKNPKYFGVGSSNLKSETIMLEAVSNNTLTNIEPDLKINNVGKINLKRMTPKYIKDDPDQMWYFQFEMPHVDDTIMAYYLPDNFDMARGDYMKIGLLQCFVRDVDYPSTTTHDCTDTMDLRSFEPGVGFRCWFNPGCVKEGKAYMAVKPLDPLPLPQSNNNYRRKRSATPDTNSTIMESKTANFSFTIATTGCRSWDESTQSWVSKGCSVLRFSTINQTICRCPNPPGNMFATTFYVPPNMIDFSAVWSKFDPSNASVYGTVIALLVVYALICIWARREDKKDLERWATHFLCDSDSDDKYFYLISVHTGLRRGAGTKSLVNFVLAGEEMDSGVRIMSDGIKQGFETGSVRKFFMGTPEELGELTYIRIWHDNSGTGDDKGWYLHRIVVDDPQTNQRYVFICDKWLAAEQDDGMVERLLPVCGRDNLVTFDKLFSQHARFNLTENHLWLSMLMRPQQSSFTRVQRLSCIIALLFLTMIANAMFFKSQEDDVVPDGVSIGSLRFSLTTIYVSIIGIVITTPPILLVTFIFKKAKMKLPKKAKVTEKYESDVRNIFKSKAVINQNEHFSDMEFYSMDHLPLPHWTIYIAWVVVVLAIITSAFFLILYSMEWGKPKSEEWLSTFVFSFVESLLFVDPVKVIVIAVLLALLFKKPVDSGGAEVNMEKLKDAAKLFNAGSSRTYLSFRNDVLSSGSPPSSEHLERMRIQRQMEIRAQEVFIQLIFYVVFAFIIYSISYINRDQRSFLLKDNINSALFSSDKYQFGFSKVRYTSDFTRWMEETLFPKYFPEKDFANQTVTDVRDKQYFSDFANARIGPARLRQVRMKRGTCDYSKLTEHYDCVPAYNDIKEDTNNYCAGWNKYNKTCATNPHLLTEDAWVYKKSEDIWGIPIAGEYGVYGGGGYILQLDKSLAVSLPILRELQRLKWINRETRAVFVEFTLYNANTNLFAYAVFLAEYTETGGLVAWLDIQSFRPYQHTGGLGTYAMICYFIYMIVLLVGSVKTALKLKKEKCKFFANIWNVIDTICVILSYVGIVLWALRYVYASKSLDIYYNNKNTFINFQHVVVYDYMFNVIVGVLVFIGTIRILRILGYNKRMTQLAAVIANASSDLSGFAVVFSIVFFAYVSFGYLLFGIHIYEYRNLFATFGSLTNALIGKNSLDSMTRAVPNFSQFYYFTYVFFVILTLMTMFAVILNQSISEVRADIMKVPQTYGIMDVLTNSVKDVLGVAFRFKGKNVPEKEINKSRYIPVAGKKAPELDAPNILRLVRETFGDKWEEEDGVDPDQEMRRKEAEKQLLILDSYLHPTPGAKGKGIPFGNDPEPDRFRAETPGDIRLTVETPSVDKDKLYSAYI